MKSCIKLILEFFCFRDEIILFLNPSPCNWTMKVFQPRTLNTWIAQWRRSKTTLVEVRTKLSDLARSSWRQKPRSVEVRRGKVHWPSDHEPRPTYNPLHVHRPRLLVVLFVTDTSRSKPFPWRRSSSCPLKTFTCERNKAAHVNLCLLLLKIRLL